VKRTCRLGLGRSANDPQRSSGCFAERDTREYQEVTVGSVRLDARQLHRLGPFLRFLGNEFGEVGGRTRQHGGAEVGKPPPMRGIVEARIDRLVQLLDDVVRRRLGRADAQPPA
jgi:hypothetical protein